ARKWIKDHVQDSELWPIKKSLSTPGMETVTLPGTASWISYGPSPLDSTGTTNNAFQYGIVSGRVNAIAVDPTDSTVAYFGATADGVWKTTNLGSSSVTWTPLFEKENIVTQAVGAIEIDPNDHNIIYVGSGDFDANDQHGEGIMKS